jgi:GTP-binding protein
VLVLLLDPTPLQELGVARQLDVLQEELAAHSPELAARPRLIAVNKVDALDPDALAEITSWAGDAGDVYLVSAITGEGLDGLLHAVADVVEEHVRRAPEREGYVLHRPVGTEFTVERRGDEWVVRGRSAVRAANLSDLTVPEAADFVARRLERIGVNTALANAGAEPGDDVRIGELVFTYQPDQDHQA